MVRSERDHVLPQAVRLKKPKLRKGKSSPAWQPGAHVVRGNLKYGVSKLSAKYTPEGSKILAPKKGMYDMLLNSLKYWLPVEMIV